MFGEYRAHVALDGPLADVQGGGDLGIGPAAQDVREHVALARAEVFAAGRTPRISGTQTRDVSAISMVPVEA